MIKPAEYRTISGEGSGEYKEKGSKFLAFARNVETEEDVREYLEDLRARFHDARHHCYAWVLDYDGSRYRANDDGEPSHSAGDPILGQLRSLEITNVVCVVVRYFGGTKLGVSGLINAYRTAAAAALENTKLVTREITREITLVYPYDSTSEVMRLVDEFSLQVKDQEFQADCRMTAEVNTNYLNALSDKVSLLKSTGTLLTMRVREDTPS